jgi:tetratricopeptide (TPR) repeat protein
MADKDTGSGWSLALSGDFQTAYSMLSRDIAAEPQRAFHYMNRGLVLLNLSQLIDAQRDFARYSEIRPHSVSGYIMFGLVLWLQNDIEPAIESWRRALQAPYTDEAGGVEAPALLYYAGLIRQDQQRLDEARGLLRKKWRSSMARVWALFLRRLVERPQLLETEYYLARHALARFGQ